MQKTTPLVSHLVIFGIPLLLLGILVVLMQSSFAQGRSPLHLAITIDLVLVVPLVYYLLIRKTKIPRTTIVPVLFLGVLAGTYFLPREGQNYLRLFKSWAIPIIELGVFALVFWKIRKAVKTYRKMKGTKPDFYTTLKQVCSEIVPGPVVPFLATEIAVFYYGFIYWKREPLKRGQYTYHKNSGSPALMMAFVFIIGIETVAIHLLLEPWSTVAAWVLTVLSAYTGIQVFGFARSMTKLPHRLTPDTLELKYGILQEIEIPLNEITSIEKGTHPLEKDRLFQQLSPLGEMEGHNVIIRLNTPLYLTGIYGKKKEVQTLGLYLDQPLQFTEDVKAKNARITGSTLNTQV